jgi:hypothetical protein
LDKTGGWHMHLREAYIQAPYKDGNGEAWSRCVIAVGNLNKHQQKVMVIFLSASEVSQTNVRRTPELLPRQVTG